MKSLAVSFPLYVLPAWVVTDNLTLALSLERYGASPQAWEFMQY
ncbi:hypothetical protein PAP_07385 [Palaeococcus pacificus DY20341]|uniref:Uncharacterized protein n=1 Tax=Palaeococcus pacificus DY20341 TaxID=1343739 RepID=A0A075LV48_9EURY|nr:hypothetical protein [Palaeococcus pacificus]AIF69867.1 hypothetical protein PAP_07385 [Palaeococcus pacificus DY20341]